jgi:hypothetical protein
MSNLRDGGTGEAARAQDANTSRNVNGDAVLLEDVVPRRENGAVRPQGGHISALAHSESAGVTKAGNIVKICAFFKQRLFIFNAKAVCWALNGTIGRDSLIRSLADCCFWR